MKKQKKLPRTNIPVSSDQKGKRSRIPEKSIGGWMPQTSYSKFHD